VYAGRVLLRLFNHVRSSAVGNLLPGDDSAHTMSLKPSRSLTNVLKSGQRKRIFVLVQAEAQREGQGASAPGRKASPHLVGDKKTRSRNLGGGKKLIISFVSVDQTPLTSERLVRRRACG